MKAHKQCLPNFIIGGTYKAATTSVFGYLRKHPEVCGSFIKEPSFFLKKYTGVIDTDQLTYSRFFTHCNPNAKIFMEATVAYLEHGRKVAKRIESQLDAPKLLFILRDPVDRLYSYYRYYVQTQLEIPSGLSFEQYIELCQAYSEGQIDRGACCFKERHLRALVAGRYAYYLREYLEVVDPARIKVMFYEDLKRDNPLFMQAVCKFLDINPAFYDSYQFKRKNVTYSARSKDLHHLTWYLWRRFFKKYMEQRLGIKEPLATLYRQLNGKRASYAQMAPQTRQCLQDYYRESEAALKVLLGREVDVPWKR